MEEGPQRGATRTDPDLLSRAKGKALPRMTGRPEDLLQI